MWHVALESWQWIHQVAAPCNVAGGCAITCHEFRPNVRHIGIVHLVSFLTISPQSTCHSAPVCEILSKSDHPRQKKMTSCRFLRRRISAILDFRGPIMGSLKSPCTTSRKTPWRGHQGLKNVPGGTGVLGKWKSVHWKITIRALNLQANLHSYELYRHKVWQMRE